MLVGDAAVRSFAIRPLARRHPGKYPAHARDRRAGRAPASVVYTISAALAGISGALIAQTTGFVGLTFLGLDRSGSVLIMPIIGGVGRLYGAFIGVPLYMIAQDRFSTVEPVYWYFWIGLLMVLLVGFARGGVLGLAERLQSRGEPGR